MRDEGKLKGEREVDLACERCLASFSLEKQGLGNKRIELGRKETLAMCMFVLCVYVICVVVAFFYVLFLMTVVLCVCVFFNCVRFH